MKTGFLQLKIIVFLLLFGISNAGLAQEWQKDYATAVDLAKVGNKNILLVFSGSDWCAPCIKLDKNVWRTKVFNEYVADKLVLYKVDFPKRKKNRLPEAILNQNKILAEKYGLQNFPMVILLDENEVLQGQLVNLKMTPKSYISKIEDLLK